MKAQENFESKTISHEVVAFQNSNRSSNRNFGLVFAVIFLLFALFLLWEKSAYFAISALLALVFCVIALVRPILLAPLNGAWFYFGNLLHRFVSPIIMGGIFFLFFVNSFRGKAALTATSFRKKRKTRPTGPCGRCRAEGNAQKYTQ